MPSTLQQENAAGMGISGLDDILCGGLPRKRMYLLQGAPGVGKTTMALQFLLEGARAGERCLYVTLSETREELLAVARSHGWSLDPIAIYEVNPLDQATERDDENTLYVPAEVELGERMKALLAEMDRVQPQRVVIDSCSELRLLAQSTLRFRRQILALKVDLGRRDCTIVLLENPGTSHGDSILQSLVHGVIVLEQLAPLYGAERRRLRVMKLREIAFRGGYHDFVIRKSGLVVFPRLVAAEHPPQFARETASSGITQLDSLLGGGLERGTSTLVMGPAGSGKSSLATQYAVAAAHRGEQVAMFAFDEGLATLFTRAKQIGMSLDSHVESGRIRVQQVDPAELSPGEFIQLVVDCVERSGVKMIVIDSLNGYMRAMPEELFLTAQLHELLTYLRHKGVVTVMVVAQHGMVGPMTGVLDVSYIADCVVLTRYFEAFGRVHKAISVVKKRTSGHEDTIREFTLGPAGFTVGPPLREFQGVLNGVPEFRSDAGDREAPLEE